MRMKTKAIGILIPMLLLMVGMFNVMPTKANYEYNETMAQSSPLNNGFDNAYRWIHYGNVLVRWEYVTQDWIIGHGSFINERDDSYEWSFDFTFRIDETSLMGEARLGADRTGDGVEDFIIQSESFSSWSGSYSEIAGGTSVHFIGTANWDGVSDTPFDIGFNDIQNSDGTWAYITIKGTVANREYQIWTDDNIDQTEIFVDEDVSGYQYWWAQDRDCDGIVSEGLVEVDYGPFGGVIIKNEGTAASDFGFEETDKAQYGGKVIHMSMSWVPGVTVPGEENKFIIKYDGTEAYVGGFQTPLFWDSFTIQGDPPGPYLIMNKFYFVELVDADGNVDSGFYVEYQYFTIPDSG